MLQSFDQGRFFGRAHGSNPNVLALHGWARSHRDFDGVLSPPSGGGERTLAGIAVDLPGFGASPAPSEPWGSAQYAAALDGVLREMNDQIVVLGHSFGGRVAIHLAVMYPERIKALVLTGVPLLSRTGPARKSPPAFRLIRALHRRGLVGEPRMEAARQRHGSADYKAASGIMRDVLVKTIAERYDDLLGQIACPVTLVWGDDDQETPLSIAERAQPLFPRAELVVCPGAGHLTPRSVPSILHDTVVMAFG